MKILVTYKSKTEFTKRYADVPSKRAVFDIYSRKLAEWTLTRADILDIARWWSYEFWEKAFTKDWSLVKTISADMARDVWKDLKEVWKRWLDEADLKEIERLQEELVLRYWVKETAQAFGATADVFIDHGYPYLYNDPKLTRARDGEGDKMVLHLYKEFSLALPEFNLSGERLMMVFNSYNPQGGTYIKGNNAWYM